MIRLKAYALAALGLLSAIMAALFYREKAARETEKRKSYESALKDARSAHEIDNDVRDLSDAALDAELRKRRH